jgi:hypothetical protein
MRTTLTMISIAVLSAVVLGLGLPLLVLRGAGYWLASRDISADMLWPFVFALMYGVGPLSAGVSAALLSMRIMRVGEASDDVPKRKLWGPGALVGVLSAAMSIGLIQAWFWLPLWIH